MLFRKVAAPTQPRKDSDGSFVSPRDGLNEDEGSVERGITWRPFGDPRGRGQLNMVVGTLELQKFSRARHMVADVGCWAISPYSDLGRVVKRAFLKNERNS